MKTKKAGAALPVDTAQWGELMQSDLINRMPRIAPLIQQFKILESNEQGFGLGLFFLDGERVFIPVVAKEWKIQPIDILVNKADNKTEMAYLCERNIIKFLTTPSFGGKPGKGSKTSYDSPINMFSPEGGYGNRTANPFNPNYGLSKSASLSKAASECLDEMINDVKEADMVIDTAGGADFAIKELEKTDMLNHYPELAEYIDTAFNDTDRSTFAVIERDDSVYKIYNVENPEGAEIDPTEVKEILSGLAPEMRQMKTASLIGGSGFTSVGPITPSQQFKYLDPTSKNESIKGEKTTRITQEGIYYIYGQVGYINPNTVYLDGSPTHQSLVVLPGKVYMGGREACGIDSTNSVESGQLSKDVLLPTAVNIKAGDIITIFNTRTRTNTVPMEVILPTVGRRGVVTSILVRPLEGNPGTINIMWYGGVKIIDEGRTVKFPYLESEIQQLTGLTYGSEGDLGMGPSTKQQENVVEFARGGGDVISVTEDGKYVKTCQSRAEFLYFAVKRYGLGLKQASELTKKIAREKRVSIVLQLREFHTKNSDIDFKVKEAIKLALGFAHKMHKFAAASESPNGNQNPPGSEASSGSQMQGQENPDSAENAKGALSQKAITQTKSISRNAQEVVELLTYYALGNIRKEELTALFGDIQSQLTEIESSLSKTLLLAQMDKIQGVDYAETKMMLSDIDNYLARISSAKALGELS